jgi:hypothetical protein
VTRGLFLRKQRRSKSLVSERTEDAELYPQTFLTIQDVEITLREFNRYLYFKLTSIAAVMVINIRL